MATKALTATGGISLLVVMGAFAANGEKLFASLTAGWQWLMLVVDKMPLGILSFALALAVGCGVMGLLRRIWPANGESQSAMHLRLAVIEITSIAAAFVTGWTQQATLMGGLFSLIAGLGVSVSYRLFASLGDLIMTKLGE